MKAKIILMAMSIASMSGCSVTFKSETKNSRDLDAELVCGLGYEYVDGVVTTTISKMIKELVTGSPEEVEKGKLLMANYVKCVSEYKANSNPTDLIAKKRSPII